MAGGDGGEKWEGREVRGGGEGRDRSSYSLRGA